MRRMNARLAPILAVVALLAACASDPKGHHIDHDAEARAEQRAQQLASSGYHGTESATLSLAFQQWAVAGEPTPVTLAFPTFGSQLPLVVYLPGLGEGAQAGSRWRQAWARAGYAVLSAQPLEFDAGAWGSDLARNADFKALSRAHQKPELVPERLRHVRALLEEARRRAAAGDSLWTRVDFNNIAFVGYDIGTLSAVAVPGAKATLLLSPLPLDAATVAAVEQPLLMIDSRHDNDLTGLITSPQDRVQSFASLPAGNKALLLLDDGSHAMLSGNADLEEAQASSDPAPTRSRGGQGGQGGGQGRHSRGMSGGGGNGGGNGGGARPAPSSERVTAGKAQAQVIETVSIAFLDAHLRGRAQARQWLDHDAEPWMENLGDWQQH